MRHRSTNDRGMKPRSEPPIDQHQIIHAALELLDEVGFEGLTMRRLAAKIGIKAASLYWHVRDKQELVGLLADEICGSIPDPDRSLPWQEQLEALGYAYRRVLHEHRDAARVLANAAGPTGPNRLRLSEIVLRILLDAGFAPRDAAYAGMLLNEFVVAFVADETQTTNVANKDEGGNKPPADQDWEDLMPASRYPSLVALAPYLGNTDPDERFQFGLDIVRSGLESHLACSHGSTEVELDS